jgi:hypothetical protein
MTYEDAVNALVTAGLMDKANVAAAVSVIESPSVDMTYPAWAAALVKAGLIDKANVSAAADAMQNESMKIADDDPQAFEDALRGAGIL